jgi:hypothetical protein
MASWLVNYGLCYVGYFLEVGVLLFMLYRGRWKRLTGIFLYLAVLVGLDGVVRFYVLHYYGVESRQYAYAFYVTDFFLALASFLLVCSFFRRACVQEVKMWSHLRLLLVTVFLLVAGYTVVSLYPHHADLGDFRIAWNSIVEFEQNLYFTCLVLNTLLYLLMQQIASTDEELELLVCGVGIQFAAPAAGWALMALTQGGNYAPALQKFIMPLCTAGMLLTWFYAIAHPSKAVSKLPAKGKFALLAQATLTKM